MQSEKPLVNLDRYEPVEQYGITFFINKNIGFVDDIVSVEFLEYRGREVFLCTSVVE